MLGNRELSSGVHCRHRGSVGRTVDNVAGPQADKYGAAKRY